MQCAAQRIAIQNVRSLSKYATLSASFSSTPEQPVFPFHHAIPVANIDVARSFYGSVLSLSEGRSSAKWIDFNLFGSQLVCHWAGEDYKCIDYYNPVDGDEVPVPHFGTCLSVPDFLAFAEMLGKKKEVDFIIEPHLRFQGQPGEQYTMFFKDPFNNNLEFKAMTNPDNLFAKYLVTEG